MVWGGGGGIHIKYAIMFVTSNIIGSPSSEIDYRFMFFLPFSCILNFIFMFFIVNGVSGKLFTWTLNWTL